MGGDRQATDLQSLAETLVFEARRAGADQADALAMRGH